MKWWCEIMAENKNDVAWEKIFEKYDLLSEIAKNGVFEITADKIREFREPRLMTKFDHKVNLPKIFSSSIKSAIIPDANAQFNTTDTPKILSTSKLLI